MNQILKSIPAKIGIGALITVVVLAFMFIPGDSKLFTGEKKIPMVQTESGNYYEVVVYQYTAGGRLDTVEFLIDPRVIDSLGFTRDQISSCCSMLAYLAADLSGQRFKFADKQEVRIAYGSPMVIIKGQILPHDSYFVAKALKEKENTLGPYMYCYKEELESVLKERAK